MKKVILYFLSLVFITSLAYGGEARLLRYPNAGTKEIVFCFGGDLYSVPVIGGLARKLTTSDGLEMYPRFSPDETQIAFTGEYDGNREIYTIPKDGGLPKRLTYSMDMGSLPERMGPDKIIMQWLPEGNKILYRGRGKSWSPLCGRLYEVSTDGKLPEELPLMWSGYAYYSPDKSQLAMNRIFREYRTWKHYRGGQADDIWITDSKTKEFKNISNNAGQDIIPMWYKDKIYYLSDRDHTMNLFCYDIKTAQTKKITNFNEFDVKFPSLGPKYISFENGGYIYLVDLSNDEVKKVNIEIAEDFPMARTIIKSVKDNVRGAEIAPDAQRALFSARGDIFTAPRKNGLIRNLTNTPGAHDRDPVWSPDGKWIAYISDENKKDEVYIIKADGTGKEKITTYPDANASYRFKLLWSPDSKKLLCSDKLMNIDLIDPATKTSKTIIHSKVWEMSDFSWSPDSKWVVYSDAGENEISVVYLYNIADGTTTTLTDSYFGSYNPVFSKDGKYVFFASDRTFRGKGGAFEYNVIYENMTTLFAVCLQDTLVNPITKFESDEVKITEDKEVKPDTKEDKKEKKDKKAKVAEEKDKGIRIDLVGIRDRIFEIPGQAANYYGLTALDNKLYYVRADDNGKSALYYYDFKEKEENEVGDFTGYEISADGKSILIAKSGNYYIEDLGKKVKPENQIDLTEMKVTLDKRAEWNQIFDEAWRQMKCFLYDPNMHGVDWDLMYKRYKPLVEYVVIRDDLTYIIGEMIGELNIGHAYVGGGDAQHVERVPIGLLAADFAFENGAYKITKILEGRNWDADTKSPLTEPGLKVKEGDYILAVDGVDLSETNHPFKALVGKADKYVTLLVNSTPNKEGARSITIKTITNESKLRYFNWVENNRRFVEKATNGKIGYVHIPDMGYDNGLNEFFKYYFPQANKDGMIVDDRYNGGGNVSPLVIERLRRELVFAGHARNQEQVSKKPDGALCGPLVCLINQQSMSDGDMFPYQFKTLGMGKLIGKRSWGGVIGIRGSLPFLDGGYMMKPEFGNFGATGKWVLEGVGQEPDIEVENNPWEEYYGKDAQLQRGIDEVTLELKSYNGPKVPTVPPFPNKSK